MIKLSGKDVTFGENTISQSGQRLLTKSGIRSRILSGNRVTGFHWNGHRFPPPVVGSVLYLVGYPAQGSVIQDFSGQGNNGTIVGATWVRLPSGLWALSFDGDDKVTCDISTHVNGQPSVTFITFFKATSLPALMRCLMVTEIDVVGGGLELVLLSTGYVRMGGRSVITDAYQSGSSLSAVSTGAWIFASGTMDFTNDQIITDVGTASGYTTKTTTVAFGNNTYTLGTPTHPDCIGWDGLEHDAYGFVGSMVFEIVIVPAISLAARQNIFISLRNLLGV